jgi:hypothetical protein
MPNIFESPFLGGSGGSLSDKTFTSFGGAASDLFSGFTSEMSAGIKAQGMEAEATSYDQAAALALLNEQYTKTATAVKETQNEREVYQTISQQEAGVAGGGLAESGSALDLLRSSASQGALSHAIIGQQGLITEAGYQEQHDSYTQMAATLRDMASKEKDVGLFGEIGSAITGGAKLAAGIATLVP